MNGGPCLKKSNEIIVSEELYKPEKCTQNNIKESDMKENMNVMH